MHENMKTCDLVHLDTNKRRISHLMYLKKDNSVPKGIIPLTNQAVKLIRQPVAERPKRNASKER